MITVNTHTNSVQNATPYASNTMYRRNSVTANKNSFERTPDSDVVIKTKQDKTKTALSLGALTTVGIGIVYAIKKAQVKNINNIQKAFQDVFLREDISIEETKAMLKRYREIEKIKNKKEYTKALFEEAKKNYRIDDTNYELAFDLPYKGTKRYYGFYDSRNKIISISSRCPRNHLLNTMHHEFRHAIQHRIAVNSDEGLKLKSLMHLQHNKNLEKFGNNEIELKKLNNPDYIKLLLKNAKEILKKHGFPKTEKATKEYDHWKNHQAILSIPQKYSEWKDKCIACWLYSDYCNPIDSYSKYFEQYVEKDARQAGRKIEKFVRGEAFSIKIEDLYNLLTSIV